MENKVDAIQEMEGDSSSDLGRRPELREAMKLYQLRCLGLYELIHLIREIGFPGIWRSNAYAPSACWVEVCAIRGNECVNAIEPSFDLDGSAGTSHQAVNCRFMLEDKRSMCA